MKKDSKHSTKSIAKMRKALKGRVPWNKGLKGVQPAWNKGLKGFRKGYKQTDEHKKKIAKALKGNKNGLGHKLSIETKEKMSQKRLERKQNLGYLNSLTTRKKMSQSKINSKHWIGEQNPNWNDGVSFILYPQEFNKHLKTQIRKRDKFVCQLCYKNGWEVHHIDYDKKNCNPLNLITLCKSCHSKTGKKSKRIMYRNMLKEKVQRL